MERKVYVRPESGAWLVVREGGVSAAPSAYRTLDDAISVAREIARDERGMLIIHNPDGTVRHSEVFRGDYPNASGA
jgi:hypothetical protein